MEIISNSIPHIPLHPIRERTRIGNDAYGLQFVLAFEDGEFRVYNYEYEEYYNIDEWERDYRDDCCNYFYNFDYVLKRDTLRYTRLDLDEWVEKTINDLIAWVNTYLNRDEIPMDLNERIAHVIAYNLKDMGVKVYQYYK